jgi:hypothetical protein
MADLVLSLLFELHYAYVSDWMVLMLQAKSCERQVHNCVWFIASGPFDFQFVLPACNSASDWFVASDAPEVLVLMCVSQRLAACGVSMGIRPATLRYSLTPTWLPNPFEWERFRDHNLEWPEELLEFLDDCDQSIEQIGRRLSEWKVAVWRTAHLWRFGWNPPLWFRG